MTKKETPIIILNYKTYAESTGKNAVTLSQYVQEASDETGVNMAIAPQAVDLYPIIEAVDIPVYSQHMDNITPGGHTGSTLPEALKETGITGTLINHSEQRLTLADIDAIVEKSKQFNLTSVLCTNNVKTSAAAASFNPDYIAIEQPELIGTGIPVSKASPEVVEKTVEEIHKINNNIPVLCGAGISTGEDMKAALELGAEGVLLASGIIKADDQKQALIDLVSLI
ncbi:triose-phosphate isomerase [uncultured Methanosphaera sp.]|uniref:triose-phosphate isomerase n=1 Tax=uncultured Methanosphaera sp. TaxID=262501 RepID=UPI000DC37B18|nr:triose-phosphate isomerase [uncultured Methanosphaera sp.]RAP43818.1 MAG: triose-phosphate isomerase [Methanosphaera sp. SHI1033]